MEITYLKSERYGTQGSSYNRQKLSRISIYNSIECTLEKYDDLETFNWNLAQNMRNSFEISDKQTFDKMFIEFGKNLNELSKEL